MNRYQKLLQEFKTFVDTLEVNLPEPEDEETAFAQECKRRYESDDAQYWYQANLLTFDDVNCCVDKSGNFGIRTDDDFWAIAHLPKKFRYLKIEDIAPILWPGNDYVLTPMSPSSARKEWLGAQKAIRLVEAYRKNQSLETFLSVYGDSYSDPPYTLTSKRGRILNIVTKASIKRQLLKLLPKEDPLHHLVMGVKQKAMKKRHRRYIKLLKERARKPLRGNKHKESTNVS